MTAFQRSAFHGPSLEEIDAMCITLVVDEEREDGSVVIRSPELAVFSAVGSDEDEALKNAISLVWLYLESNWPDYVDLRRVRQPEADSALPAHMIAYRGGGCDGHTSQ